MPKSVDHKRPSVSIVTPSPGATVAAGPLTISGVAADNVAVAIVYVSINGGAAHAASGTTSWTAAVDLTGLTGTVTIDAKAVDAAGNFATAAITVAITAPIDNQPPTIAISAPTAGVTVAGKVAVGGTAADDVAVVLVEVAIDAGAYVAASGLGNWSYIVDATSLAPGSHTIHARATDDVGNQTATSVAVTVAAPSASIYWGAYLDPSPDAHYYGAGDINGVAWQTGWSSYNKPGNTWDAFETHAAKTISVLNFGWAFRFGSAAALANVINMIWSRGAIPSINMNWGASNTAGGVNAFTNAQIAAGANDTAWADVFDAVKGTGRPVFLLPCVEMNGHWTYEGGLATDGTFPGVNNPTNFVAAWKHLKDLADSRGATNISWVWVVNFINPDYAGIHDAVEDYWPGSSYADWTGVDTFNWAYPGPAATQSFADALTPTYDYIVASVPGAATKPMYLSQVGASAGPSDTCTDKAGFITGMLTDLPSFAQVKAFAWFNWYHADSGTHDIDIETPHTGAEPIAVADWPSIEGMAAAAAFRAGIASAGYKPKFSAVPSPGNVPVP